MKINVPNGRYVLAVSGGADSIALLNLLVKKPGVELVVAHFHHGIRSDSTKDEELVAAVATKYALPYEVGYGHLGKNASEETARNARYNFLEKVKKKYKAEAIITAHHQDDLLETAFINLIRGTGYRGLVSIRSKIIRPLLNVSKKDVLQYAKSQNLQWRNDVTNEETKYLRNYLRQNIIPKLSPAQRAQLTANIDKVAKIREQLDKEIATISHLDNELSRPDFTKLPSEIGAELLTYWFRQRDIRGFDRKTIARISTAIKTAPAGTKHAVIGGHMLELSEDKAALS